MKPPRYEILLLIAAGFTAMEIVEYFHYPKATVYNWARAYKTAGQRLSRRMQYVKSGALYQKKRSNNLGEVRR